VSNRRYFFGRAAGALGGTAGAVLLGDTALAQTVTSPTTSKPTTFIQIHGTFHGGWVWRDVRRHLQGKGHRVFSPSLTGCGDRAHLINANVGLETHIQDILNLIKYEELDQIVLVGQAFAGPTITGVADKLRERIRHICFFDAIAPSKKRNTGVPREPDGALPDWFLKRQEQFIDGYQMVFSNDYPIDMLVPPDSPHAARIQRLLTPHPAKTWTDRLSLVNGGWKGLPRSFIHCVGQQYRKSSEKMIGPARGPGWKFIELDIPRDGMVTHPRLVAETLLSL